MEQPVEITAENVRNKVAKGKQYSIRFFKAGPHRDQPEDEQERIQMEHLKYGFQLKAQGKVLLNGPIVDDPVLKGISIFDTTDLDEVKRLSDLDPAVKAGRLIYEVYPWFGIPGEGLPE